ncbi:type VII secretion protein EccB [Allocatelliglobosispora scoriae]|uniref:Type VII secretion protein EccB n=1 Tax=Allocatelliglobosispora scoriae TaxID=643052 RepID=A0A841C5W2_9ACTN|nr:type VII secretion protein EccB [Allocatelliglobosispora scoriae]MBB5874191.1 type VII secretion protein EccB [Allocatelliglobosispora scoriae]
MQNRRDQVQAHSFVLGRLVSALLRAEPDAQMTPLRRFVVGTVVGVLVGAVALIGFGAFGFFVPGGSKAWQAQGVIVVEKETGARYVVVDGVLRPVVNYTSARLILGRAPTTVSVSRKSLAGVPHGLPIGIVSAPDYLPDPAGLDVRQWRVCSGLRQDATGASQPSVALEARRSAEIRASGVEESLLVRTPDQRLFLIWGNQRLRLPEPAIQAALGYAATAPRLVGWSFINAIPAGPDLSAEYVASRGTAGARIGGQTTVVGQLFKVDGVEGGTGTQYFVMRSDGLSPLTATGAALQLADPGVRTAYPGRAVTMLDLTPAALAGAPRSPFSSPNPALPAQPPRIMTIAQGELPCLLIRHGTDGPQVSVGVAVPGVKLATEAAPAGADTIVVEAGRGLLMRDLPAPGVTNGTLYLLADTGIRYPLAEADVAAALGYAAGSALPVPGEILALLPVGRPLDPVAARLTVPAVAPSPASP